MAESDIIYVDAGGSALLEYELLDANGDPLDLTGYTLDWECGPDGGLTLITKTPAVTDVLGGMCEVYLSPADVDILSTELRKNTNQFVAQMRVDPGGAEPTVDIISNILRVRWTLFAPLP